MTDEKTELAEVAALLGGTVSEVQFDHDELAVSLLLSEIREQLMIAAQSDGVGVNQLAARLDVAPSSVSRFMGGESDMRVSTMVLYGRALAREWKLELRGNAESHNDPESNFFDPIVLTSLNLITDDAQVGYDGSLVVQPIDWQFPQSIGEHTDALGSETLETA